MQAISRHFAATESAPWHCKEKTRHSSRGLYQAAVASTLPLSHVQMHGANRAYPYRLTYSQHHASLLFRFFRQFDFTAIASIPKHPHAHVALCRQFNPDLSAGVSAASSAATMVQFRASRRTSLRNHRTSDIIDIAVVLQQSRLKCFAFANHGITGFSPSYPKMLCNFFHSQIHCLS